MSCDGSSDELEELDEGSYYPSSPTKEEEEREEDLDRDVGEMVRAYNTPERRHEIPEKLKGRELSEDEKEHLDHFIEIGKITREMKESLSPAMQKLLPLTKEEITLRCDKPLKKHQTMFVVFKTNSLMAYEELLHDLVALRFVEHALEKTPLSVSVSSAGVLLGYHKLIESCHFDYLAARAVRDWPQKLCKCFGMHLCSMRNLLPKNELVSTLGIDYVRSLVQPKTGLVREPDPAILSNLMKIACIANECKITSQTYVMKQYSAYLFGYLNSFDQIDVYLMPPIQPKILTPQKAQLLNLLEVEGFAPYDSIPMHSETIELLVDGIKYVLNITPSKKLFYFDDICSDIYPQIYRCVMTLYAKGGPPKYDNVKTVYGDDEWIPPRRSCADYYTPKEKMPLLVLDDVGDVIYGEEQTAINPERLFYDEDEKFRIDNVKLPVHLRGKIAIPTLQKMVLSTIRVRGFFDCSSYYNQHETERWWNQRAFLGKDFEDCIVGKGYGDVEPESTLNPKLVWKEKFLAYTGGESGGESEGESD